MKLLIRLFHTVIILCLLATAHPARADEHKIDLSDGLAFPSLADMEAEIVFPMKLAGFLCLGVRVYDDPGLGYSLRYMQDDWGKVDIYVYRLDHPAIPDGPDSEIVKDEARAVSRDVKQAQRQGYYKDVRTRGKSVTPMSGRIRFIREFYEYTEIGQGSSSDGTRRLSESYITGFNDHFVKIRFTYDAEKRADAKARSKSLVEGLIGLLQETPEQQEVALAAVRVFQADPVSDAGRLSMRGFMQYAVETEDFTVNIPAEIFPWMENGKDLENSELLFAGYIAGVMQHVIQNNLPEGGEAEGFASMLELYQELRDDRDIQAVPELDAWLKAEDKEALFKTIAPVEP